MKLYQVDAFTDKLFQGNPAGVCILEDSLTKEVMQNIAMEMNLSKPAKQLLFSRQK
ncbi:PhzF family phenazine biosynthesis protein [Anaerocellum danielii]|uniref:PhzF family phenazine biosynthesis protein n=1 Tax=Anaerocellum danielii TaxID=1387557 RepID=A0ABZ0TW91_9FIRM|nr:PhzF family phenazine biosynthesis protein [Caldicellulosiruptor danielii]WPX07716.1 PhzF family phenazine biosynthesis protein [Caldicellulosiruptor danielii]